MKKNLLLMMMCVPVILVAQNGVTVSNLAVNSGTVTFNMSWNKATMPAELWSDTVWVFVDYNNAGKMERLPLLSGATLTATSPGGKVIEETDNNKGVWVAGNARDAGAFSATVKLLTAVKDVGGACVYGSNYPPVGKYISATEISFTGTPMYNIVLKDSGGDTDMRVSGSPFSVPDGFTVQSFTDKTSATGIIKCIPMTEGIDFSVSPCPKVNQPVTFTVNKNPTVPPAAAVTYTWSAPNFDLSSGTGSAYVPTTPATTGTYPVTLTVYSEVYCDLSVTKDVEVYDYELCAVSAQTWVVGTQTWSAPLTKAQPGCTAATDLGTTNPPTSALYRSPGFYRGSGYLYNWKCVNENSDAANPNSLCPSPWRVPTRSDFITLDIALGGTGSNRNGIPLAWIEEHYVQEWGAVWGGGAAGTGTGWGSNHDFYWTSEGNGLSGLSMVITTTGIVWPVDGRAARYGLQVRCVK
jgi:uncharacterized protein (TIGR02145 family)